MSFFKKKKENLFLHIDFSLIWKGTRNKENHEKNNSLAFSRTEVEKRLESTAMLFSV
jgi:hypothetical protein